MYVCVYIRAYVSVCMHLYDGWLMDGLILRFNLIFACLDGT